MPERPAPGVVTGPSSGAEEPPDLPRLTLWPVRLDLPESALRELENDLSSDERDRAGQYRHELERNRFIAARARLRELLAGLLHCRPDEVRLVTDQNGKPRIESSDLKFNGSRSAGTALFATSWTTEVGVDIEAIREIPDIDDIAARFFSPAEQQALQALPATQRLQATFQCWTCKEAYGKAIGKGLSFPSETVDTWTRNEQPTSVSNWSIHQIDAADGFAAAVAGTGLDGWTAEPLPEGERPN